MLIRIVKMKFREEELQAFRKIFDEKKRLIRNFPGCRHLELWQDADDPGILFTYSIWESETDLNHYRFSDLFKETWSLTRKLFAAKAEAWSLSQQEVI